MWEALGCLRVHWCGELASLRQQPTAGLHLSSPAQARMAGRAAKGTGWTSRFIYQLEQRVTSRTSCCCNRRSRPGWPVRSRSPARTGYRAGDGTGPPVESSFAFVWLAHDHRLVNGRQAAAFLAEFKAVLEDPARLAGLVEE
jgi:hypothetical protein